MENWHNYLKGLCEKHKLIQHNDRHDRKFFGPHWDHFVQSGIRPKVLVFKSPSIEKIFKAGSETQSKLSAGFSVLMPTEEITDDIVRKIHADTRAIVLQFLAKIEEDKRVQCNPMLNYFQLDDIDLFEDGVHAGKYMGTSILIPVRQSIEITYSADQWL